MTAVAAAARTGTRPAVAVPWVLGGVTVLLQVCYPLLHGHGRDVLTVVTVVVFFAASVTHAALTRSPGWAARLVLVTAGAGLLVEAVGTATGYPFGAYRYAGTLGWQLLGVPVIIPLAWSMMAYPALLVGRVLAVRRPVQALVGGVALASWDLFLDPQMVAAGHWRWTGGGAALPGLPGIPATNFAGWLLTAVVMMSALVRLPEPRPPAAGAGAAAGSRDAMPFALYLWTYASSVLAAAVFFGRPAVALVGAIGMGTVAVPLALRLLHRR